VRQILPLKKEEEILHVPDRRVVTASSRQGLGKVHVRSNQDYGVVVLLCLRLILRDQVYASPYIRKLMNGPGKVFWILRIISFVTARIFDIRARQDVLSSYVQRSKSIEQDSGHWVNL